MLEDMPPRPPPLANEPLLALAPSMGRRRMMSNTVFGSSCVVEVREWDVGVMSEMGAEDVGGDVGARTRISRRFPDPNIMKSFSHRPFSVLQAARFHARH